MGSINKNKFIDAVSEYNGNISDLESRLYVLFNDEVIKCSSLEAWINWSRDFNFILFQDEVRDNLRVLTYFTGIDVGNVVGMPVLFKSVVYLNNVSMSQYNFKYMDNGEATEGHDRRVAMLVNKISKNQVIELPKKQTKSVRNYKRNRKAMIDTESSLVRSLSVDVFYRG